MPHRVAFRRQCCADAFCRHGNHRGGLDVRGHTGPVSTDTDACLLVLFLKRCRAYHHVNLLHLAVPLYIKCLEILDEIEDDLRMSKRCTQVGCWKPEAFCHSKLPVRNEFCSCLEAPGDNGVLPESHHAGWSDGAGSAGKTISGADAGMKFDREQIKRVRRLLCQRRQHSEFEQS